ncbi:MAG: hypothetical protein M3286_08805, partial [Thermoproteota archaeon]|nr:hypothetical protein [Thermoproteota archaeon]
MVNIIGFHGLNQHFYSFFQWYIFSSLIVIEVHMTVYYSNHLNINSLLRHIFGIYPFYERSIIKRTTV